MSTAKWLAAALAGTVVLASSVHAGEQGERETQRRRAARRDRAQRREGTQNAEAFYQRLVKELGLSEQQQASVKQVLDTHAQEVKNWQNEHGEKMRALSQAMNQARRDKKQDVLKAKQAEIRKLFQQRNEMRQQMQQQVMALLTDEQKAKFKAMIAQGRRGRGTPIQALRAALPRLGLTDAQKDSAEKILHAAQAQAVKADKPADKAAILAKAVEDVKKNVLTPEQVEKLSKMQQRQPQGRAGMLGELGLSQEQTAKLQKALADAREKAAQAGPDERRDAMRKAWTEAIESILTPEQLEKLKQLRQQRRNRTREQGQGRRGDSRRQRDPDPAQ